MRRIFWLTALCVVAQASVYAGTDEWTNVGPEGGFIWQLVVDPQNPAIVYARTGAGLFKSNDHGASWNNSGLNGFAVYALIVDPQQTNMLYAAATNSRQDEDTLVNVFKSTDGGASWIESDSGLPGCCVDTLAIDPQETGTLYALNRQSQPSVLFKSTDAGANWRTIYASPSGRYLDDIAIDPKTPGTLYAAGHLAGGVVTVFKSLDGGTDWSEADVGLPIAPRAAEFGFRITADPGSPDTLYATVSGSLLFKTTDGAASWRPLTPVPVQNPNSQRISGFLIDPEDDNTLYAPIANYLDDRQPAAVFKSADGGLSWTASGPVAGMPYTHTSNPVMIDPGDSSTIYAATVNGVYRSTDGGVTFVPYSQARAQAVSSVALNPERSGTVLVGVGVNALLNGALTFQSTDAGMTWSAAGADLGDGWVVSLAFDPQNPSIVYAGTGPGNSECGWSPSKIFRSVDGGTSWTDTQSDVDCLSSIVVDPRTGGTVYASSRYAGFLVYRGIGLGSGIKKSTDGGMSWNDVSSGLPVRVLGPTVTALTIDPQNTRTLFASDCGDCGVFKSTDGGAHWVQPKPGIPLAWYSEVIALAVDPKNPNTVYAAIAPPINRNGGLWKSVDGGANWRNVFSTNVYAVAINPQDPATISLGTDNGLARSTDGGDTWTIIPGGPGRISVLALDPQVPDTLYAGGDGGLFAIRLSR